MIGAIIQKPTIRLPFPHPGQKAVRQQAKRFNWIAAGRRWRKTTMLVTVAVEWGVRGYPIVWGAPTFDQVRVAWKETKKATGTIAKFTQQTMTAEFPGGGAIIFRSLDDPDNARGHTAWGVIIDEAGDVKEDAWYEVLRPMLIDTNGWAWVGGTPKGRNWFWREWMASFDRKDSNHWQIPTVGCEVVNGELIRKYHPLENPDIAFSEIEQIYRTTPERTFRQEILAEFIQGEGVVFRNISACTKAPTTTPDKHVGHKIVAGLDWAKHNDFTATSLYCVTCGCEVAKDRFNQIDYHFQRGRLGALWETWGVKHIEAEQNSIGEPNLEELQRSGYPVVGFQTTATSKPQVIESLALCFEKVEGQWLDDPIWTGELEAYEMKVNSNTGRPTYSASTGLHDDTVIARALAWKAATYRKPTVFAW